MKPLAERFNAKFTPGGPDDCWLWHANKNNMGYGMIRYGGLAPKVLAHRVAYELKYGLVPEGLVIRHTCDTPACVNPTHLETGTQSDNLADRTKRGRFKSVVITEEQAEYAIVLFGLGWGPTAVAKRMGVSLNAIKGLHLGRTRKYLTRF